MRQVQTAKDLVVAQKQRDCFLMSNDQQVTDVLASWQAVLVKCSQEIKLELVIRNKWRTWPERHRRGPKQCRSLTEIKKFEADKSITGFCP